MKLKEDKLKIGQKIIVTKKTGNPNVVVGDLAIECGYTTSNISAGWHQFHSTLLVDQEKNESGNWVSRKRGISYWVEFLPRHCYKIREETWLDKLKKFLKGKDD